MNDLISRQAVLDILSGKNAAWDAYQKVAELPSAERPKGKWIIGIKRPSIGTQCDACGWAWSANIDAVKLEPCLALIKTRYCPNCGAEMEKKE